MGNKNLPKLTHGYLRRNKIPSLSSLLRQPWPIWAKGVDACRFTGKPRQQPLTDASTGVDHTRASPDDKNQFGSNGSCSARGFHGETGKRMYDALSVRGKKFEPDGACTVCTCGERSIHFIEDMMNLLLLFTWLKFIELWLSQKKLAPCCACTCGKRPKQFIDDINFEIKQRCGTCPPSKQNRMRFTCQLPTMGSTCLHWSLWSFLYRLLTSLEY